MQRQLVINRSSFDVLQAFLSSQHTSQWWNCQTRFAPDQHLLSWQWCQADGSFTAIAHARVQEYEAGLFLRLTALWHYNKQWSMQPIGPFEMLFECTPQAGQTLLTMELTANAASVSHLQPYMEEIVNEWDRILPKLQEYLERHPTIF